MMESDGKDPFLEEVDQELRSIEARLKKVLSEADTLLKEHCQDRGETQTREEESFEGL